MTSVTQTSDPDATVRSPGLTVCIMAYNEVVGLEPTVLEIRDTLNRLDISSEVLIIDDGSTDGTGDIADRLAEELPSTRVAHHPENRGVGEVYWTGFEKARGDLITFFPADNQFPAGIISDFVSTMPDADLVISYIDGSNRPWRSRFLSLLERLTYRLLFGAFPKFQGVMMFRRELLDKLALRTPRGGHGWVVVMEIIIRASRAGCRIVGREVTIRPRIAGHSHVNNPRAIIANLIQVVQLRLIL